LEIKSPSGNEGDSLCSKNDSNLNVIELEKLQIVHNISIVNKISPSKGKKFKWDEKEV